VGQGNKDIKHFDTSCFSNSYVTGDINAEYLASLEALRNDDAQMKQNKESFVIEI
jgi:amidophosphoribosyltransferase